jgi:putative transposase
MKSSRFIGVLREVRGLPEEIVIDHVPKFTGQALNEWTYAHGVRLQFIEPGKPIQNTYTESFNGKLRDECPSANYFLSLADAQAKIEACRGASSTIASGRTRASAILPRRSSSSRFIIAS